MFKIMLLMLVLANIACVGLIKYTAGGNLEIYALNVGQGDAIFIRTPDHRTLLIDGGQGERVVGELATVLGPLEKLDVAALTHADADHIGGLATVYRNYGPSYTLHNQFTKDTDIYQTYRAAVRDSGSQSLSAAAAQGNYIILGCCVRIDILWPWDQTSGEQSGLEANDLSLSLLVRYRQFSFLASGDLSIAQEDRVARVARYLNHGQPISIVKISHHGSKTSTSVKFLNYTSPSWALISVGQGNSYGHPAPEVIERLTTAGIKYLQTSRDGRLQITTNGHSFYLAKAQP